MAQNNSVLKSFKILDVISQYPDGITLTNIVKETGLPKSTVFDICAALYQVDAIYYKNMQTKTYVIGSKMYVMGQVYTQNSNFINAAMPLIKEFAEKYELTVTIAKKLHNTSVNVYKYESKNTKVLTSNTGYQIKLCEDVCGKVFLAYLPRERKITIYNELKLKDTRILDKQLDEIKRLGYALNNNVSSEYIYSIAVPVFNFENKNIGVITATSLKSKFDINEQITSLQIIANEVSKILGYQK